ncbi:ABC transporter permease [Marinitoga sp. 1135]|uniref:ABC-type sugar transport system, permease component n=1 Tax=Marinitoga piezophila (strain DSM 14283 / JCM 11233 / KA3) TaxID=443254 RepID=H2J7I0_MARPK|nr:MULTISPECIES: carbohydrate ABC transporter permease [Marinitoga]AEX86473.1 ABC-type sugar transport system, permease component [Marinitoga piezophila KA3]APT76857.1 ABC transporter permease [Marinitoga sp. 1137]NUU96613.1 ABC transporter permease [Marinitoga sp. 1135]NUU98549.1 ABC transporter permease [Marinitoga sp. 1138]
MKSSKYTYKKILYSTLFYIVVAGIILVILTPIYFLVTISLMSDQEAYDWPTRLVPSFYNHFRIERSWDNPDKLLISVYSPAKKRYITIIEESKFEDIKTFIRRKTNSEIKKEKFDAQIVKLNEIIEKNKSEIDSLVQQRKLLERELNQLNVDVGRLMDKISMAEKIGGMEDLISQIKEEINNKNTRINEIESELSKIEEKYDQIATVHFSVPKKLFDNYVTFFRVTSDALPALLRSIEVAFLTVFISLIIGGMAGYAFARYTFKGKNWLKLSVLFVRMFPGISIAMPMVIILINMGFYDKPIGLSLVYSVGQIGMTIWITASIFMGISVELEEAAMIFGTTRFGAFMKVTLPLALPGLAASAMYAFIGSWAETAQAIVLTQFNPTFPVVVYQTLVGAKGLINLSAAGGVSLALPAIIFTLIIRRYILQMWGGVRV